MEMEKNVFKKMTFSLNSVTMDLKKNISIYLQLEKNQWTVSYWKIKS